MHPTKFGGWTHRIAPSLHDQYEEIVGFVMQKCEDEERLYPMTHALTAYDPAPACENSLKGVKFEGWEAPGVYEEPWGLPGKDMNGIPADHFNFCPYPTCNRLVWVSVAFPMGKKIECLWCHGMFRRTI